MISVIVPIYNVEQYLVRCIESIRNQTYNDLEIILVDDGSTDTSGEICDSYLSIDERIRVIHKKNGGLSDARNVGIDAATGDFIGFVDSDDYIHEKMYEVLYRNIELYQTDIAVCDFRSFDDSKVDVNQVKLENIKVYRNEEIYSLLDGLDTKVVVAWNKLYRRRIFRTYRYELGRLHEDQWAIHHILYEANSIVFSDLMLYFYYVRNGSITKSDMNSKKIFDLIGAFVDASEFFKQKGMDNQQMSSAYKAANYVIYFYRQVFNNPIEDKDVVLKELRRIFKEIMKQNENVFSSKQVAFRLFAINPWLGIGFRIIKNKN